MTDPKTESGPDPRQAGNTLRAAREALLLSQDQLARAAGVSVSTVARLERGSASSAESLKSVCAVLGLDAVTLRRDATGSGAKPAEDGPEPDVPPGPPPDPGRWGRAAIARHLGILCAALALSFCLCLLAGEIGTQRAASAMVPKRRLFQENMFYAAVLIGSREINRSAGIYSTLLPADHPDRSWRPWSGTRPISWLSCGTVSYIGDWLEDAFGPRFARTGADPCRDRGIPQRLLRRDDARTDFLIGPNGAREIDLLLARLSPDPSVSFKVVVTPLGDAPGESADWYDPRGSDRRVPVPAGESWYAHVRVARVGS